MSEIPDGITARIIKQLLDEKLLTPKEAYRVTQIILKELGKFF